MVEPINFKPGLLLTFKTVVSVRDKLCTVLKNNASNRVCLDLTEVTDCDSAGLALLIETRKLCAQDNRKLQVKGISDEMLSLAEFCGVKDILEIV